MFNKFILAILILTIFGVPVSAQVLDLSSANSAINLSKAEVYKPSKLVLGGETKFVVKGDPGSKLLILFSDTNSGGEPFGNLQLQLGKIVAKEEGSLSDKGIAEVLYTIVGDKTYIGKKMYFEAVMWTKDDYSDAVRASIIEINGRKTLNNALVIVPKPKDGIRPGFNTMFPGIGNVGDTIDSMRGEEGIPDDMKQEMYYREDSIMLRNLRAPELQQDRNDNDK